MYILLKPLFSRHKGIGVQFMLEPTGALDSKSGRQIMELFDRLNEEGVTIVMITHDAKIASYAKRVIHIIDGEIEEAAE